MDEDWEDAPDAPLAALRLATAKLSVSDATEGASPDGKKRCVPASPGSRGVLHCSVNRRVVDINSGARA